MKIIKLQVSKTLQAKIQKGHPWVFDYQIQNQTPEDGQPGDLGIIYTSKNKFLAIGFYDPCSEIRLRILQWGTPLSIDNKFFAERLQKAIALRSFLEKQGTSGYRVINGENANDAALIRDREKARGGIEFEQCGGRIERHPGLQFGLAGLERGLKLWTSAHEDGRRVGAEHGAQVLQALGVGGVEHFQAAHAGDGAAQPGPTQLCAQALGERPATAR